MDAPNLVGFFTLMHQENKRLGLVKEHHGTLYGVRQETLEAYLKAERKKIWEAVYERMSELDTDPATGTYKDSWIPEWWDLKQWVREHAEEAPDANMG